MLYRLVVCCLLYAGTSMYAQNPETEPVDAVALLPKCECTIALPQKGDTVIVDGKPALVTANGSWVYKCPRSNNCTEKRCKVRYKFKVIGGSLSGTRTKAAPCRKPAKKTASPGSIRDFDYLVNENIVSSKSGLELMVSPNPVNADQQIEVMINMANASQGELEIRDVQGNVVYRKNLVMTKANHALTLTVSTTGFTQGIYLITIRTEAGVLSKRLIVE
ncbi:MAG: T9SS type A sorting domain-containing protein [Bacteroidia bacterium]